MDVATALLILIAVVVIAYLVTVIHSATLRTLAEGGPAAPPESRLLAWPRWFVGLVVVLFALWALSRVRSILTPFILGAVIAYMLNPLVDRMAVRGIKRNRAISLVFLAFLLLFVIALLIIVPLVASEARGLVADYGDYVQGVRGFAANLERLAVRLGGRFGVVPEDVRQGAARVGQYAQAWGLHLLQSALGWLNRSLSLFFLLIVTPVVTFWLLRDYHNLGRIFLRPLPKGHRQSTVEISHEANRIVGGYLLGLLIMTGLVAVYSTLVLTILGVRFSVLLGVLTGVLSIIPYLGFPAAMLIIALTMLVTGKSVVLIVIVLALHFLGNLASDNLVYPRVIGGRVGLHPLVVIFSILAGGALLNFLGVILAVPLAGVVKVLLTRFWPEVFPAEAAAEG